MFAFGSTLRTHRYDRDLTVALSVSLCLIAIWAVIPFFVRGCLPTPSQMVRWQGCLPILMAWGDYQSADKWLSCGGVWEKQTNRALHIEARHPSYSSPILPLRKNFIRLPLVNILGLGGRRRRLFILVNNRSFCHFANLDHFEVGIMHSFVFIRA